MINLGWGNYANGKLPESAVSKFTGKPDYLEDTAMQKWLAMRQACFNATGRWINVAPGASAYRDYAQQVYFYNLYLSGAGNTAAVPGTSNHGWGRAVDITGYETANSRWVGSTYVNDGPVWRWLQENAGHYGYSWATGKASRESWHWESLSIPGSLAPAGGGSTPLPELIGEDMVAVIQIVDVVPNPMYVVGQEFIKHLTSEQQATDTAKVCNLTVQKINTSQLVNVLAGLAIPQGEVRHLADVPSGHVWSRAGDAVEAAGGEARL